MCPLRYGEENEDSEWHMSRDQRQQRLLTVMLMPGLAYVTALTPFQPPPPPPTSAVGQIRIPLRRHCCCAPASIFRFQRALPSRWSLKIPLWRAPGRAPPPVNRQSARLGETEGQILGRGDPPSQPGEPSLDQSAMVSHRLLTVPPIRFHPFLFLVLAHERKRTCIPRRC